LAKKEGEQGMAYTKAERKKAAKKGIRTKRKRYGKNLRKG